MDETQVVGRRFGVTADTHDVLVDWPKVLTGLKSAWGKVDGVLHCGDLTSPNALERLEAFGPVYATRSEDDPPAAAPRLCDGPRVLNVGGVRVGMTFALPEDARTAAGAAALFGGPVAVCLYGATHEAHVGQSEGVAFVNPGSPSLAKVRTAAVLTIDGGRAAVEVVEIA
jgi:putative phosphoesterase